MAHRVDRIANQVVAASQTDSGGGGDTITITDNRNGKRYRLRYLVDLDEEDLHDKACSRIFFVFEIAFFFSA